MSSSTRTSDANRDLTKLSALGKQIVTCKEAILKRWCEEVVKHVPAAAELHEPILIDTTPDFIHDIAEAVSPAFARISATSYSTLASEHGGERARLSGYTHKELIKEYQILRWTFLAVLKDNNIPVSEKELQIINASIDEAIQIAASNFTLVHSEMREHFVATLSHDMKNPLAAINMTAEMLLRKTDDPEKVRSSALKIKQLSRKINMLIDNLLDQTLIKSGGKLSLRISSCEISSLIDEVKDDLSESDKSRIIVSGEKVKGHWDPGQIQRAIENLITNAVKYSEPESTISISIRETHGRMIFSIHNDGPPISAEDMETIFQVFRRSEAAKSGRKKGWGLGLPLVRAVAEAHGGSIEVQSSKEYGTKFTMDIPLDARPYKDAPTIEHST